ncbi:MAG TPA: hypothetical protein VGH28_28560 [Polyangiaceae bacterium]
MSFAALSVLVVCCAEIAGVKPIDFVVADAATEASNDASTDAGCQHVLVPTAPANPTIGGSMTILDAVQTIDFNPDGGVIASLGFDLDGVCTCGGGPASCTSLVPNVTQCDPSGGRDINGTTQVGHYLEQLLNAEPSGDVNARIAAGKLTYFIQVSNYGGGQNESELVVGFYDGSGHPAFDADGGYVIAPPAWDGGDVWAIDCIMSQSSCPDAAILDGGFAPTFVDPAAYVTDGTLVAHFNSLVVGIGITTIRITSPIMVAQIEPLAGGGYGLDGQFTGRVAVDDIFRSIAVLPSISGGKLCGDDQEFQALKPEVCGAADIRAAAATDNTNQPCDALSFSLPFVARPARIGFRSDGPVLVPGCDGAVDECTP